MDFSGSVINWYLDNKRQLPWRNTRDPYRIWLSEIILQQTRVAQGLGYFNAILQAFPNVESLAQAPEDKVLRLWQGLGYYSRARNLHSAAKQIMEEFDGVFPTSFQTIKSLKGVGDYTAAAIASFAYGLPHAVVDGNVYRLLSRYYGIETPIDSTAGKKQFALLAQELLDVDQPDTHNQAIMEFGALQCTAQSPNCVQCPLKESCIAYADNIIDTLPVKTNKVKQRKRFFVYVLAVHNRQLLLVKRNNPKDIWYNLYQFPMVEVQSASALAVAQLHEAVHGLLGNKYVFDYVSEPLKHVLSHQVLSARFVVLQLDAANNAVPSQYLQVPTAKLQDYAVPRLIDRFMENLPDKVLAIL